MDRSRKLTSKGLILLALLPMVALVLGSLGLAPAGAATESRQESTTAQAVDEVNLVLRREGSTPTAIAGRQFKYTLSLTNNGPEMANDVLVEDALPDGFSFAEASSGCTITTARTVTCRPTGSSTTIPPYLLPAGATVRVDLVVQIDADITGSFPNAAKASAGNTTVNFTLQGSAIPIVQHADLQVRKFGRVDGQVQAGEELTYTIVVDNWGPSVARNVVMADVMGSDGTFELLSVSSSRTADCSPATGEFTGALDLTCDLTAPLEVRDALNKGRWTITVVVRASESQIINNLAAVESDAFDPVIDNNEARAQHKITDVADLALSKTSVGQSLSMVCPPVWEGKPDQVTAGAALQYVLTIDNSGPSSATNVLVRDQLPSGFRMTGVTPSKGSCNVDAAAGSIVCGLGTVPVGSSVTITIDGKTNGELAAGTLLVNNAQITSGTYDNNNGNDFANNVTTVDHISDIRLTKEASGEVVTGWDETSESFIVETLADEVNAGGTLTYRFSIGNEGPLPVSGITLEDKLPFAVESATGATCQPDETDPTLTVCAVEGAVAAGETHVIELSGQVADDLEAASTITNQATVLSPTTEACAEDNTAVNETLVSVAADRHVLLENDLGVATPPGTEDELDELTPGSEHRYRITIGNNGPSLARELQIIAKLHTQPRGELSESYQRCEPIAPVTVVDCAFELPNLVRIRRLEAGDEVIFPSAASGQLSQGAAYSFHLVTRVSDNFLEQSENDLIETTVSLVGTTPDFRNDNNMSAVTTRIVQEIVVEEFLTLLPMIRGLEE